MHMLWHDDVSVHAKSVGLSDPFQRGEEDLTGFRSCQLRLPVVAAEGEEMVLTRLLESIERPGHEDRVFTPPRGSL